MNITEYTMLALEEMKKWGLLEKGWTVTHSKALTTAGMCIPKTKNIQLSTPIFEAESDAFVLDTIRHEIAHALDESRQRGVSHGSAWKRLAVMVGADPTVTFDSEIVDKLILAKAKYVMVFGTKIVQVYQRKPNRKTILNIKEYWAKGKKEETIGKLEIHNYNPAIHVEYVK